MNKKSKISVVEEDEYGLYIWVTDKGERVADSENRTMNIPSRKNDFHKMSLLAQAARAHGVEGGKPVFLSARRQVTDSEWEDQMARLKAGLIADPYDYNAIKGELRSARKYGQ